MDEVIPVVAIDGPSGAGKGTIAQRVAEALRFDLLDSGALYRLSALAVLKNGVDPSDEDAVVDVVKVIDIAFESVPDEGVKTLLNGEDVTSSLRNEDVAAVASQVASLPKLREQLLQIQRNFRQKPGLVADGRDMGTVVFPDAAVKVYLTASPEVRASRRQHQLKMKGIDAKLGSLLEEISKRDARDSGRATAPLKPAADAIMLDSSALTIEEVTQQVLDIIHKTLIKD